MIAVSQPGCSGCFLGRSQFCQDVILYWRKRNLRTRAGSKSRGWDGHRVARPGHRLPSNRLSSQLSGGAGQTCQGSPSVQLDCAVEDLGGQHDDLAPGRHPEGEQHSAVARRPLSLVSFATFFVYPPLIPYHAHKDW